MAATAKLMQAAKIKTCVSVKKTNKSPMVRKQATAEPIVLT